MAPAPAGVRILASRTVDPALQERFCSFSGDRNPSHADPLLARRTAVGEITVHGAHNLLWALDTLAQQGLLTLTPSRIRVRYLRLLLLGQVANLCVTADAGTNPSRVWVAEHGSQVCSVDLEFQLESSAPFDLPDGTLAPRSQAVEHAFNDLKGSTGEGFVNRNAAAGACFPAAAAILGARLVAELAACSYLVGMEAPGRHSMSSGMDLKVRQSAPRAGLGFTVTYADERFRKLRLALDGATFEGTLEAFVAPPPVAQPGIDEVITRVSPGEFNGMRALVVGGSRGLGELTAKLIAAGGGSPTITYARGEAEAKALVGEIQTQGMQARSLPLDIGKGVEPALRGAAPDFTHLFYFATNAIFRPSGELVCQRFLDDFLAFYGYGFYRLCAELSEARTGSATPLIVFYPSTTALDDRPAGMTEYAMAKAAGEQLCRDINQTMPGLAIHVTRLPRLATDQTAGVLPGKRLDTIEVLLPVLRQLMQKPANPAA